ncbi:MAG TPA: hypothetical protein VJ961_02630 [Mariprofundaceae bacterium]|nr:hypothetical protein [Mariprofundaceae bacterium]
MNVLLKEMPSEEGQVMLNSLKQAVSHALERKRRLGQYAVVWKDGQPVRLGEESDSETQSRK